MPKKQKIVEIRPIKDEEEQPYTRSVQIATLHTQVLVTSNDPKDTLKIIKEMAIDLVDKYKNR